MFPPLQGIGQGLVQIAFALILVQVAVLFQPGLPLLGRIAPVGIDISARVARANDSIEVLAVVHAGGIGHDSADKLMPLFDDHLEFVAIVAHALLFGPGRIQVFLVPLGWFRVARHRVLFELFLIISGEVLTRCRYQSIVNDLATQCDEIRLEELRKLIALPVQQLVLHLLIGQVEQALKYQNAHHGLGGKRWPATLWTHRARNNSVNLRRQSH